MDLSHVEQGFSSFFAIFDDFAKWNKPKVLRNFEKSLKYNSKNEEKSYSTCLKNHFSANSMYPKIRFRVSDSSLMKS